MTRWSSWEPGRTATDPPAEQVLRELPGPVQFRIPGRDRSRCRALSTLLHGNEPSGLRALLRYLRSGATPATDALCFLGAVEAARIDPPFSQRCGPSGRDLNRCFREPFPGPEGELAAECLETLRAAAPEALVDLHNTSGRGPAYAVVTETAPAHNALASLFTQRLIVTDLRLGTLVEATTPWCPSIVVECGGAGDPAADEVAYQGLCRYFGAERPCAGAVPSLEVFEHPVRVELCPGRHVAFSHDRVPDADVVLDPELDRHNFGTVAAGERLGWLGRHGIDALRVRSATSVGPTHGLLEAQGDRLVAAAPFRPLMITTRPDIAESDCLFYAVRAPG